MIRKQTARVTRKINLSFTIVGYFIAWRCMVPVVRLIFAARQINLARQGEFE